jgi:ATP-independent RNA helicase DbpA
MGLIEVKDFFSFIAIKKARVSETLRLVKEQKIKNQKVKIAIAK